jgi:hypothetical protein
MATDQRQGRTVEYDRSRRSAGADAENHQTMLGSHGMGLFRFGDETPTGHGLQRGRWVDRAIPTPLALAGPDPASATRTTLPPLSLSATQPTSAAQLPIRRPIPSGGHPRASPYRVRVDARNPVTPAINGVREHDHAFTPLCVASAGTAGRIYRYYYGVSVVTAPFRFCRPLASPPPPRS